MAKPIMNNIVHFVHIKMVDVERLECIFAYLTEDGWKIPAWLILLKTMAK